MAVAAKVLPIGLPEPLRSPCRTVVAVRRSSIAMNPSSLRQRVNLTRREHRDFSSQAKSCVLRLLVLRREVRASQWRMQFRWSGP